MLKTLYELIIQHILTFDNLSKNVENPMLTHNSTRFKGADKCLLVANDCKYSVRY